MVDNKAEKIKVLLVDDHVVLRKGMIALLGEESGIAVVGEAGNGEEAITQVKTTNPDVVIMDISMPGINGIDATRQIVKLCPQCKVIALSIHSTKRFVDDMLNAGAVGYMLKESVSDELFQGIKAVMRGEMYLSGSITGTVVEAYVERMSSASDVRIPNVKPILMTKLHRPSPPLDLVPRFRLMELLNIGRTRPLTLVSGPAGYGKSTLISCWIEESDWTSAWLSLDEGDSDLRQFLRYVITSVQNVLPGTCKKIQDLINSSEFPSISMLTACLTNELETIDQPLVLVLDDYHYINAESDVNTFLHQLLSHPLPSLHLVILSRRDPPLQLVTLRANGQITEIRMHDLRFDAQETRLLLEADSHFTMSDEALSNLENEIEGWVVGLRLVSLVLHKIEDPELFLKQLNGGVQQAQQYLIQEVLSRQLPHIQDWMLKTAILNRFCAPLCDAVCVEDDGSVAGSFEINGDIFIEELLESNLFAIPLDSQGEWFRYHHLFQNLLYNELKRRISSDEIMALHKRVSDWHESEGHIEEAISHALMLKNNEGAAKIVERHRHVELDTEAWGSINNYLTLLPTDLIQQRPELLLAQAWVYYNQSLFNDIESIVYRVGSMCEQSTLAESSLGELNFFRGVLSYWNGDGEASLNYLSLARQHVSKEMVNVVGFIEIYTALANHMTGEGAKSLKALSEGIIKNDATHVPHLARLHVARSFIHLLSGELVRSMQDAQYVRKIANFDTIPFATCWAKFIQAACAFRLQDIDTALSHFIHLEDCRQSMQARPYIDSMVGLSLSYQACQKPDAAKLTIQKLLDFSHNTENLLAAEIALSAQARLAVLQNDLEGAIQWLHTCGDEVSPLNMFIWIENPTLTKLRVLNAMGSNEQLEMALGILEPLQLRLRAMNNTCQMIEVITLHSMVLANFERTDEALTMLTEAVSLSEDSRWVSPFLELGQPMNQLIKLFTEKNGHTDFLRSLLERFKTLENLREPVEFSQKALKHENNAWVGEPLTNRELDILELLTHRLQNKEIAAKLFVSPETIKSHLKHLYQKLGVSNRREAGVKAAEIISVNTSNHS